MWSSTEMDLPNLARLRSEGVEPKCKLSRTLSSEPNRLSLVMETTLSRRLKLRRLNEDPSCVKLKMESFESTRAAERRLTEEPSCSISSTDI